MTDQLKAARRDKVLFAFHRACTCPTAEQITKWTKRHPEFAEDIRMHAAIRLDWAASSEETREEPDELLLERGRSRALNAIYNAQVVASSTADIAADGTFEQLMAANGMSIPQLARSIDIERSVLADLVSGRMHPPINQRFVDAFTQALPVAQQDFNRALKLALKSPKLGYARANQQPTVVRRSYKDIIRSSSMSEERRAYWLGEN